MDVWNAREVELAGIGEGEDEDGCKPRDLGRVSAERSW